VAESAGDRARVDPIRYELSGGVVVELVQGGVGLAPRLRASWDDLDEVVPLLRHRVDTGVDADTQSTAAQRLDVAPRACLADPWATRHTGDDIGDSCHM
jgi:hypothetical protein